MIKGGCYCAAGMRRLEHVMVSRARADEPRRGVHYLEKRGALFENGGRRSFILESLSRPVSR